MTEKKPAPVSEKRRKFLYQSAADPLRKQKGAFRTQPISQKDDELEITEVALPDEDNVEEARDWVNFNKK